MSTLQQSALAPSPRAKSRKISGHEIRVLLGWLASGLLIASLAVYGFSYYILPIEDRPYSDKYELLKPGGTIGIRLGIFGTVLFCIIFLYALRKVIPWLGRIGTARQWMDFHVIAGVTAPFIIAFHASFKFQGLAGTAFWIMLAVALSGIIGRYLYAKIPRSVNAAELSLAELDSREDELTEALERQSLYRAEDLHGILRVPSPEHIRRIGPLLALLEMLAMDLRMPFQLAALRRSGGDFGHAVRTAGGLLPTGNPELETVIRLVRQKASLSRRLIFLAHTQRVFHIWHIVHRPFSYAFAVLAVLHIAIAVGLGFL